MPHRNKQIVRHMFEPLVTELFGADGVTAEVFVSDPKDNQCLYSLSVVTSDWLLWEGVRWRSMRKYILVKVNIQTFRKK